MFGVEDSYFVGTVTSVAIPKYPNYTFPRAVFDLDRSLLIAPISCLKSLFSARL